MEDFHLGTRLRGIGCVLDVDKDVVAPVAHLDEAHVGGAQGRPQEALQHGQIAGDHPVFRRRGELVGDQLAGVVGLQA